MLTEMTAMRLVEQTQKGTVAKACIQHEGLFIVRVVRPDVGEENYDPFYSVDPIDRTVRDYSIMHDLAAIGAKFMQTTEGG